ncbi:hypothetical protein Tco_1227060 [Tanacetum coccineum]
MSIISYTTAREGSFNLNSTAGDEEDEVKEVRPSHPMGRDQAKRKGKAGKSSAYSSTGFDAELLAMLMANKYAMANDPYNAKKGQEITDYCR